MILAVDPYLVYGIQEDVSPLESFTLCCLFKSFTIQYEFTLIQLVKWHVVVLKVLAAVLQLQALYIVLVFLQLCVKELVFRILEPT